MVMLLTVFGAAWQLAIHLFYLLEKFLCEPEH